MKRVFANISDGQVSILEQGANIVVKNTQYSTNTAKHAFIDFLHHTNIIEDGITSLKTLTKSEINASLKQFWPSIRKKDESVIKKGSLRVYRHSLNRYLKEEFGAENIDIISDPDFQGSNAVFTNYSKELKIVGKGHVTHYDYIEETDLKKIDNLDTDSPVQLQWKIWFLMQLHFCRRGQENLSSMKITDFALCINSNGQRYVMKVMDEVTKNHRDDEEHTINGRMYGTGTSSCPVMLFEKYVSKLNKKCEYLWQKPKNSYVESSNEWYCNNKVGKNTISKFMKEISNACLLSKMYTNHCVRVSTCTILGNSGFSDTQIKNVSGHKSISALGIYHRPLEKSKQEMSNALSEAMTNEVIKFTENISNPPVEHLIDKQSNNNADAEDNDLLIRATEAAERLFSHCTFNNSTINCYFSSK